MLKKIPQVLLIAAFLFMCGVFSCLGACMPYYGYRTAVELAPSAAPRFQREMSLVGKQRIRV